MSPSLLLFALSQLPVVVLFSFVYARDLHEKEPLNKLVKTFLLGALGCIPAAFLEDAACHNCGPENAPTGLALLLFTFFGIACVEEGVKYLVVRFYAYRLEEFDERYDGIMYSVAASLGFAALENIFYVVSSGFGVALVRMFTAVPMHATTGVLMGYEIGKAKFCSDAAESKRLRRRGYWVAVGLHGLYDFLLLTASPLLALLALVLLWKQWRVAKQLIVTAAGDPLELRTITAVAQPRAVAATPPRALRWATTPMWLVTVGAFFGAIGAAGKLESPSSNPALPLDQARGLLVLFLFLLIALPLLIHRLKQGGRIAWLLALGLYLVFIPSPAFPFGLIGLYGLFHWRSRAFFHGAAL